MKKTFYRLLVVLFPSLLLAQIDPQSVEIVRDAYGVPHIYAPTDAGVAYGLAWAHAEDDFKTIQLGYLAGNNLLSNHLKNKGLAADFLAQFIGSKELVDKKYDSDISPAYKKIVEAYAQGLNRYAALWKPMPKD